MTKITKFDRTNLAAMRRDMEDALASVAAKYGVVSKVGNGTFMENNAKFSFELATVGENGEVNTKRRSDFRMLAPLFDLKPDDLDRAFESNGNRYTIDGLNRDAPKFPVIAKRADGKLFKFPANVVKMALERVAA